MRLSKHLRKLPPKTPPAKAKQGGVFVSATVLRNQENKPEKLNPNPYRIKPFFLTLTGGQGTNEDNLMKAFRKFLKVATSENQLRYIWKKEKAYSDKMHFHLIGDCSDCQVLIGLWTAICHDEGVNAWSSNQSCLLIGLTNESISFIAQYFSKPTPEPIANRVVGMSNIFQFFKPIRGKKPEKSEIESQITFKADKETGEILYEVFKTKSIAEYYSTFL